MSPEMLRRVAELSSVPTQVRWCDSKRFNEENAADVAPGEYLNRFGWYVIGTTIGGNAVVVRESDPAVYFADHAWFHQDRIDYKDLAGSGRWLEAPLTSENVAAALFKLANSIAEFVTLARSGQIDETIDRID